MKRHLDAVAIVAVLLASACSAAGPLCDKEQQCDTKRADDDIAVCRTAYHARISALRQNAEAQCQDLADATENYDACRAGLACADFAEPDLNGLCKVERHSYEDALKDVEGECASTD